MVALAAYSVSGEGILVCRQMTANADHELESINSASDACIVEAMHGYLRVKIFISQR